MVTVGGGQCTGSSIIGVWWWLYPYSGLKRGSPKSQRRNTTYIHTCMAFQKVSFPVNNRDSALHLAQLWILSRSLLVRVQAGH